MTYFSRIAITCATFALTAQGAALAQSAGDAARAAHDAYVAAINSNDLGTFLGTVTDDIVFIPPESQVMSGKAEVAPWVAGYFEAIQTSWNKQSVEFVVSENWAYEVYRYTAVDSPRTGGDSWTSTGHGLNIYRLETDGVWRVARDIWSSDPISRKSDSAAFLSECMAPSGPC